MTTLHTMDTLDLSKMEQWLLSDTVQLTAPDAVAGGVAGWWPEGSQPSWVYLEITGYYLTTLAFMHARSPELRPRILKHADRALTWMRNVVGAKSLPSTREYVGAAVPDWRNRAVFSFDLGMALRGVTAIAPLLPADARPNLLRDQLLSHLSTFVTKDVIESHRMTDGSSPDQLAARWSTRRGPHHVKVAGAIALSTGSENWRRVAEQTLDYHLTAQRVEEGDLHPCSYFLEGLLQMWTVSGDRSLCDRCFDLYESAVRSGEIFGREGTERGDVNAQLLRIGSTLKQMGYEIDADSLADRASALEHFVGNDGAMRFHAVGSGKTGEIQVNSWATMFAYQAVAFYDQVLAGRPIPREWVALIV